MAIVRAKDVKEYFYCPRVIFFERVLKIRIPTQHLIRGKEMHERVWKSKNMKVKKGELTEIYQPGVELYDKELKLIGKLDFLKIIIKDNKVVKATPIEIKLGEKMILEYHHKMQLIAYALLVERVLGYKVEEVAVYYPDTRKYIEVKITEEEKKKVIESIDRIRKIIDSGEMPEPTEDTAKCDACQYYNFCLGV